jgi:hypothetical protein
LTPEYEFNDSMHKAQRMIGAVRGGMRARFCNCVMRTRAAIWSIMYRLRGHEGLQPQLFTNHASERYADAVSESGMDWNSLEAPDLVGKMFQLLRQQYDNKQEDTPLTV